MTLALILPLRQLEPLAGLHEAADRIRTLSEGWPVTLSGMQTASIPGLGVVACVAVRMMDPRGPTDVCTVALGDFDRADLVAALAMAFSPRRAA